MKEIIPELDFIKILLCESYSISRELETNHKLRWRGGQGGGYLQNIHLLEDYYSIYRKNS